MKQLIELTQIVSRQKLKNLDFIGVNDKKGSKSIQLYEGIASGKIKSEKDAILLLYEENNFSSFSKLKNRLKKRLINTLFLVDPNSIDLRNIEKAAYECRKSLIAVETLIMKGAHNTAIDLALKAIKTSQKYELTEIVVALSDYLRMYYSYINHNKKLYLKFNEMHTLWMKNLVSESKAKSLYSTINASMQNKRFINSDNNDNFLDLKNIIESTDCDTMTFIRFGYSAYTLDLINRGKFKQVIPILDNAIAILNNKNFELINTIYNFELYKIISFLQLGKYDSCLILLQKYEDVFKYNTYNGYLVGYYKFILLSHSRNYTKAYKLIYQVLRSKNYKELPQAMAQNFKIFEAFANFLLARGKIPSSITTVGGKTKKKFRLYKFINDVPLFAKDKRGLNVAILIVHVLFLLHDKKYDAIIDRVDALVQYSYRYLRKDETFRSNCFIKMLLQTVKADFNPIRTRRYTEKYVAQLAEVPLNVAEQGIEVEVIPYEDLWDIVLEMLDNK
jgi:hypothetical protein